MAARRQVLVVKLHYQVGGVMWAWAALCCVVGVGVTTGAAVGCNVTFDGDTYRKESLLGDIPVYVAYSLAMDYTETTLYLSHEVNGEYQSEKFDLHTKKYRDIEELTGLCKFAVDQSRGEVHAGCGYGRANGLYQFDTNLGRFVLAGEKGQPEQFVHYYNDTLYYCTGGSYLLHTFREGRSERVHDVQGEVYRLVVDRHGDWIYYNSTGVYRQQAGSGDVGAVRYEGVDDPYDLAVDNSGGAYVCNYYSSTPGIYRLDKYTQRATRVVGDRCSCLTVDRDNNLIYGDTDNHRIVRLVKC